MKNIALINLRYKVDIAFERKESLGLEYLASVLIKNGYSVDIIDAQYFNLSVAEVYQTLSKKNYDIVAFSLYQETVEAFDELYGLLLSNKGNPFMCLGGQFPTFTAEALLKKYPRIQVVVIGEGEQTFLDLVKMAPNDDWRKVHGICYLEHGATIYTEARLLVDDLNTLPFPARDPYYLLSSEPTNFTAIISASRGCYAHCSFCSIQSFYGKLKGKKIRVRSPINVVDEIENLYRRYGIKNFFFADDNFLTVNKIFNKWLDEFIFNLGKRKLAINFDIDCRVNDIDVGLFKKLKTVGLRGIFLGIESFNQRMLDMLNKGVTVQQNTDAIITLKKMRFNVWMGFIMFDMFTTIDEIKSNIIALDTLRYFKYFNYDRPVSSDWLSSILQLYNGTPILDFMKKQHPELLVRNNRLGYDFLFKDKKTDLFYQWLLRWKPFVKRMIQLDTLQMIRLANQTQQAQLAVELHKLSRRYLLIDRDIFVGILDAVDYGNEHLISDIIEKGIGLLADIESQVLSLRGNLPM